MAEDRPVGKSTFSCDVCEKEFTKLEKLKVHLISHSNEEHKYSETSDEIYRENDELMKNSLQKTKLHTCNIFGTKNGIKKKLSSHSHLASLDIKECEISEETCSTKNSVTYIKHNLNTRKKEKCVSEVCGKEVIQKGYFRSNFCSQAKENKYVISEESNLQSKLPVHREEKRHNCEICGKTFTHNYALTRHLRIHSNEKPYICEKCNRSFAQKFHLKRHLLVHTQEKFHTCDVCSKSFARKYDLKMHFLVHTKEKPYNCGICSKDFSQLIQLKGHLSVHTNEKPHICEVCGKAFNVKSSLRRHLRVHTQEKPHACDKCDEAFAHLSSLNSHLLSHAKDKPYICKKCCKGFIEKAHFDSHLLIHRKKNQTNVKPEVKQSSEDQ